MKRRLLITAGLIPMLMLLLFSQPGLAGQGNEGEAVYIEKIITGQSDILTAEEVAEVVEEYEGRYLEIGDLNQLVAEFNKLYSQRANYLARAFLLPQELSDGVVEIKLVESRLGEISVEDNSFTREGYVLGRLSLDKGDLLRLDSLQTDLFYFNNTNDVQLKAEIAAGEEYGTSDLIINAAEPPHVVTNMFIDNAGREETGLIRKGLSLTNNSVFGWRDSFTISLIRAAGDLKRSYSYNLPVSRSGTRLGFTYDESHTDIISGQFQSIGIKGEFKSYTLDLNHPFTVKPGLKRSGLMRLNYKDSRNYFAGVELQSAVVRSVMLGMNSQRSRENTNLYLQHQLTKGYVETVNNQDEYDQFFKYNGDFLWQSLLEGNHVLDIKLQTQYSADELISSSDQYTLGGSSSVRGYPEGVLMGDSGFYLGATLSIPISKKVTGYIFYDYGGVFPYKGNDETIGTEDFLTSIGYGANLNFAKNLAGSFTVGVPVKSDEYDTKVDFILQVTF